MLEDAMLLSSDTAQQLTHAASLTSAPDQNAATAVLPVTFSHAHHHR